MNDTIEESYDVVLIGAGIGGLTCAAYLARKGKKVLVVEQHSLVGGCCSSFTRGGFTFDSGAIWVEGYEEVVGRTLSELGIRDRVDFNDFDPLIEAVFPDETIPLRKDITPFREMLLDRFPGEAGGIKRFYEFFGRVNRELKTLPMTRSLKNMATILLRHRAVITCSRRTYGEILDKYVTDGRLKSLLSIYCGMFGLPPSRVSAIALAPFMVTLDGKAGWARGGMQKLADALAEEVRRAGGRITLNTMVNKILVEDRTARGVALADGREIRARRIISNADARETFFLLLADEEIPSRLSRKLQNGELSPTGFKVFLGVEMELPEPRPAINNLLFPSYDMEECVGVPGDELFTREGVVIVFIPTLDDPTQAPEGSHSIQIFAMGDYYRTVAGKTPEEYRAFKERLGDYLVRRAEKLIPGLSDHIVFREEATPLTYERYTLNSEGVWYGWGMSPKGIAGVLDQKTPFRNLYLCGQWANPGGGVPTVMLSAGMVADLVLRS